MSFLSTSTTIKITKPIPPHITRAQVLSFLHDGPSMLNLNPIIKSYTELPSSSVDGFLSSVAAPNKPPATGELPVIVYKIIEGTSQAAEGGGGSWRGGWAKRFIPDEINYETSVQGTADGMVSLTHAPMGVNSVTTWTVRDAEEGDGLVVEKVGCVSSNRMLMTFIRTTIEGSYEKLTRDFLAALIKKVDAENGKDDVAEKTEGGEEQVKSGQAEVVA